MEAAQVKCKEREELLSSLSEKKRKSSADEKNISTSKVFKSGGMDKASQRSLKKMKEDADIIHADSQRILRETRGTTFSRERVTQKPVSSLIEKIRQRKLRLTSSVVEVASSSVDGSSRISTLGDSDAARKEKVSYENLENGEGKDGDIEFVATERTQPITTGPEIERKIGEPSATKMAQHEDAVGNTSPIPLRPPMVDTQDLYSDSQSSLWKEEIPAARTENTSSAQGFKMNLHLDSELQETQDDDLSRWLEKGTVRRNEDPVVMSPPEPSSVSNVRELLDDEAEDEDDDPLEDDDVDNEDSKEELRELLIQEAGENEADISCRSELHSKWLEQQDLAMEDSILHRMETGWRRKGKEIPEFLGTRQGISFCESGSRSVIGDDSVEGPSLSDARCNTSTLNSQIKKKFLLKIATGSNKRPNKGQVEACHMDQNDLQGSSDDEDANEKLRLQLMLEESEEQEGFLTVAEDESSRDIFTLINKVNVTTVKPKSTGHNEARTNGNGHHQLATFEHQSSFLRRKVTTTLLTTRHGSGTSRSYVFGRDESNSRDSARSEDKNAPPAKSTAGSSNEQRFNSATRQFQKCESRPGKEILLKESNSSGPSLFQILKQQAAELASSSAPPSLDVRGSKADDLASFLAVRPSKQRRKSRAT